MSLVSTVESDVVSVAKKIKAGLEVAGEDAVKVAAFLEQNSAEITGLASLAGAKSVGVTNTATSILSVVIKAVEGSADAALANGLNVSLDAAVIADVKAIIAALKKV